LKGCLNFILCLYHSRAEKKERELIENYPQSIICRVQLGEKTGILYDPLYSEHFRQYLLGLLVKNKRLDDRTAAFIFTPSTAFVCWRRKLLELKIPNSSIPLKAIPLSYGNKLVLKMYRHLDYSSSRDVEISRFLSEKLKFDQVPEYFGTIEFIKAKSFPSTLGIAQHYIPGCHHCQ
jgi:maltose alpha-D-glucosyltransferase / alpha-amylase